MLQNQKRKKTSGGEKKNWIKCQNVSIASVQGANQLLVAGENTQRL
jgi:hypothetical protein